MRIYGNQILQHPHIHIILCMWWGLATTTGHILHSFSALNEMVYYYLGVVSWNTVNLNLKLKNQTLFTCMPTCNIYPIWNLNPSKKLISCGIVISSCMYVFVKSIDGVTCMMITIRIVNHATYFCSFATVKSYRSSTDARSKGLEAVVVWF